MQGRIVFLICIHAILIAVPIGASVVCGKIPEMVLTEILGAAYNSRYMSIDQPALHDDIDGHVRSELSYKRGVDPKSTFYVDMNYAKPLDDDDDDTPAWIVRDHTRYRRQPDVPVSDLEPIRSKRHDLMTSNNAADDDDSEDAKLKRSGVNGNRFSSSAGMRQWECESRIVWTDLGQDYFPRYLRSVECTGRTCWYGRYRCKARSFGMKLLRRKRDRCTTASPGASLGYFGLPSELRDLWVWEERAVNFCCDCSMI